jgi:hypothetical protein
MSGNYDRSIFPRNRSSMDKDLTIASSGQREVKKSFQAIDSVIEFIQFGNYVSVTLNSPIPILTEIRNVNFVLKGVYSLSILGSAEPQVGRQSFLKEGDKVRGLEIQAYAHAVERKCQRRLGRPNLSGALNANFSS